MELLESDNSEFRAVNFCHILKKNNLNFTFAHGIMLGSENSELSSFALY